MTRQNLFLGTAANDGTGESLRLSGEKINANFVELYQKIGGDSDILSAGVSFTSAGVAFEGSTIDGTTTTITADDPSVNNTIRFPDASGRVLLDSDSDTVANKILIQSSFVNPSFIDSESASTAYQFNVSAPDSDRTVNFPVLVDSDTLVFERHIQTLINKTLDSATINNPILVGTVEDTNAANLLRVTATASAQNSFTLTNAATGNAPAFGVEGVDSDVSLNLDAKNRGAIRPTKLARRMVTQTAAGNISATRSFVNFNSGSPLAATLLDGSVSGEDKIMTNAGAGTVTVTPTNFAQGTSFTLLQNGACSLIWNGSNWFLTSKDSDYTTIT